MRKKGKEILTAREDNAQKINCAMQEVIQKLNLNPHTHQRELRTHSNPIELTDKVGQTVRVHLVVIGNLHCGNKQDYLFVGLVVPKRLRDTVSSLKNGAKKQKHLCFAWKEFFLIRDRRSPSNMVSKSKIQVKEKVHQSVGIGTALFLAAEEIRLQVVTKLAHALRVSQMTVEIFDENGGADWTATLVKQHYPFFVEQREKGLFRYTYRL